MSSFSQEPVVTLKDVNIFQEGTPVLTNINFEIGKGEFIYLIGRTGSGKSSLLKALYSDLSVNNGEIKVAGYNLRNIKSSKIPFLRRKVGIVFQDFQLLFDRNIAENLIFVMKATGWKDNAKIKARLTEVLMGVGLDSAANKLPHQLSGGEQQRIVIARALINEPAIMLADEPTGNLDPEVADEILQLFQEINRNGTAVFMATHNHSFLSKYPARVLKADKGKILDSSKEVFSFSLRHD